MRAAVAAACEAGSSSRTMLIEYEYQPRRRRWLVTVVEEARNGTPSILGGWPRRPADAPYVHDVIEPLLAADDVWLVRDELQQGELRDLYERDGTLAAWVIVAHRVSEEHFFVVSINRRTPDPTTAAERVGVVQAVRRLPAALGYE